MAREDITYFIHRSDGRRTELLVETVFVRLLISFVSVASLWVNSDVSLGILGGLGMVSFIAFVARKSEILIELRAIHRALDASTQSEAVNSFEAYIDQMHQYRRTSPTFILAAARSEFLFLLLLGGSIVFRIMQISR